MIGYPPIRDCVEEPIPIQPCPVCRRPTTKTLDATNQYAHVNYYTCEGCRHVWTTDKQTGAFLRHITPPPPGIEPQAPKKT